jgi:hypothetical protein
MKSNLQFIKKTGVLFSLFLFGFNTSQAATGDATKWLYPTAYNNDFGVINPQYALKGAGDENLALFNNSGEEVTYINFDIPKFPASFQITGIIVHLIGTTSDSRQLNVDLTWNDGTNFTATSYKTDFDIYNPELGYSFSNVGGTNELWGHPAWTTDDLSNTNFGIRLIADNGEGIAELAEIAIQIFYYIPDEYCNGSAVFAEGIFYVENSQNAVGKPDGNIAVLPTYDVLQLDLTGGNGLYRPANSTVTVRWAKTNPADDNLTVQVRRSLNLSYNPVINTYTVNSSELTDQVITLDGDARYLIFQSNTSSLSIDAVTYSCGSCDPPVIALGEANPLCFGIFGGYLPYTSITNCNEESRLIVDWNNEAIPDINEFLWDYSDWPDETGSFYLNLPESLTTGTYTGNLSLQTGDCTSETYPFSITVVSPPATPVATNSGPVCTGSSFALSATGDLEYFLWYGFNGKTYDFLSDYGSTINIETNELWEAGDYVYKVYQIKNSCWSDAGETTVTVSKIPEAGIFESESLTLCETTTGSADFAFPADPGGEWLSSNPAIATVNKDGEVTGISVGSVTVSYKVTGSGGCSELSDEATITVIITPLNAYIVGNNGPLCGTGTAEFYLKGTPGAELLYLINDLPDETQFHWFDSEGNLTLTFPYVTVDQTLTLIGLQRADICSRTLTGESTVTFSPQPEVQVLSTSYNITEGGSVTLTASGADTYTWSPADGLDNTTGATVIATPVKNTIYTVTGFIGTCSNSASVEITVQETCKNSPDQYEPNNSMTDNLFTIPIDLTIGANLLNAKDPDWYRLDIGTLAKYTLKCQKTNTNTGSPSVELYGSNGRKLKSIDRKQPNSYNLANGTYYIKVSAGVKAYLCYTLQVVEEGTAVGAIASFDDTKSAEIETTPDGICKLWPNPTKNEFQFYNGNETPVQVRVMDVTGRQIEIVNNVGIAETVVFGSKYKPGIYFVKTSENGVQKVFKLIKQ